MAEKKNMKRIRFSYSDDILFLKEVLANNPLEKLENWSIIQRNLEVLTGKLFLIRTLKDHLQLLLEIFRKKDIIDQKKSGIEEIYSEKDCLLQEISDICANIKIQERKRKRSSSKEEQISRLGKPMRDNIAKAYVGASHEENIVPPHQPNPQICSAIIHHDYTCDAENVAHEIEVVIESENTSENIGLYPDHFSTKDGVSIGVDASNSSGVFEKLYNASSNPTQDDTQSKSSTNLSKLKKRILSPQKTKQNRGGLLRRNALEYLNAKEERERVMKTKELELEERRIAIEEKKVEIEQQKLKIEEERAALEISERKEKLFIDKERLQIEVNERNGAKKLIESQQKIIDSLFSRLQRYEQNITDFYIF